MVVALTSLGLNPGPGSLRDLHSNFDYVRVSGQIVIAHEKGKLFGRRNSKLFGQDVDRVLLGVRRNNVRVITWMVM